MQRSISEEEYAKIAKTKRDALHTKNISPDKVFLSTPLWMVIKNEYPYIEYDNAKVLEHLLIIPRNDKMSQFEDFGAVGLVELSMVVMMLNREYKQEYKNAVLLYFWKVTGKSIRKYHLHFLVLDYDGRKHDNNADKVSD